MRFGPTHWTLMILLSSIAWSADERSRIASPSLGEPQQAQPPSVRPNKTAPRPTAKPVISGERAKLEQCVREQTTPDCDGDGRRSIAAGGDDCDDADPQRAPGRLEIPDSEGHDEDCDHTTYGEFDGDRDGFTRGSAFNIGPDGKRYGGEDCDDAQRQVNPNSPEVCNDIDDDCDGTIDEGVMMALYRDRDGDGFGDERTQFFACPDKLATGVVANASDCNDGDPRINPITGACN